jgi:hypothetical protein
VAQPLEARDGTDAFAFAPDHIGLTDCPCLGKLIERRGEAAAIWFLCVPQTLSLDAMRNGIGNQRSPPQHQPSPSDHHAKLTQSLQQSAIQHIGSTSISPMRISSFIGVVSATRIIRLDVRRRLESVAASCPLGAPFPGPLRHPQASNGGMRREPLRRHALPYGLEAQQSPNLRLGDLLCAVSLLDECFQRRAR